MGLGLGSGLGLGLWLRLGLGLGPGLDRAEPRLRSSGLLSARVQRRVWPARLSLEIWVRGRCVADEERGVLPGCGRVY